MSYSAVKIVNFISEWTKTQLKENFSSFVGEGYWYALLDVAFDPKRLTKHMGSEMISLYQDGELGGYEELAPHLAILPIGEEVLHGERILRLCDGIPMLSFVHSACEPAQLKQHLTYLHRVKTEDDSIWPLRFADTRVLPALLDTLLPEQRDVLLEPINRWLIIDRFGEVIVVNGGGLGSTACFDDDEPLAISDTQFARLVEAAEPDEFLSYLRECFPDLLGRYSHGDAYRLAVTMRDEAENMGVLTNNETARQLLVLGFVAGANLLERPEYQALKQDVSSGAPFEQVIQRLPESFWAWIDAST